MTNPRRRKRRPIAPAYPQPFAYPVPQAPAPAAFREPPRASVQVLRDKNATVANVTVSQVTDYTKGPDYTFETSGSTKREQGDRYDPQTGDLMAIGRALRNAGNEMIREANKRVQDLVAEQAEVRRRSAERRENKGKPVNRRTKAQWETIQRGKQAMRNVQLARNLGLNVEQDEAPSVYAHSSVAEWGPAPATRINLSNGRYLEEKDGFVGLYNENGAIVMSFDAP
jgi:hypothetical protein